MIDRLTGLLIGLKVAGGYLGARWRRLKRDVALLTYTGQRRDRAIAAAKLKHPAYRDLSVTRTAPPRPTPIEPNLIVWSRWQMECDEHMRDNFPWVHRCGFRKDNHKAEPEFYCLDCDWTGPKKMDGGF